MELNRMKKTMLIVALLGSALMAQSGPLPNGVYAVERDNARGKNLVIRQFEGKDLVLDTKNFAPLLVEGKPQINRDERGSWLMIQLAPEAAKRLEDLTRSHMDRPIAVVVSDKVLSAPTVRSVITDGKARVTPCEDKSCEVLLRQLSKLRSRPRP
jgi:preprotein translocase subunit SecD